MPFCGVYNTPPKKTPITKEECPLSEFPSHDKDGNVLEVNTYVYIDKKNGIVIKYFQNLSSFKQEVSMYKLLKNYKYFPNMYSYSENERSIKIEYCD